MEAPRPSAGDPCLGSVSDLLEKDRRLKHLYVYPEFVHVLKPHRYILHLARGFRGLDGSTGVTRELGELPVGYHLAKASQLTVDQPEASAIPSG